MSDLDRLRSWLPADTGLFNVYGPIESNICTVWPVPHGVPLTAQPIGQQIRMTNVSVRDDYGGECAAGGIGEIWVSGPTVSPGYWQRPELDAEKFVRAEKLRWYRTGDLGAADAEGLLTFHGRRDDLVKRRGYRIELGEIENVINTHPKVSECAVVSYEPSPGTVEICAWYSGAGVTSADIRIHLSSRIPGYMMPDSVHALDSLPKSQRDKIDRVALRRMFENRRTRP